MITAAQLRRRWSQPDRLRLVRETRAWLAGQGQRPGGLDEHRGRTDLRGIPLTASPATIGDKDDPSAGVVWDSLDLSGAQLEQLRVFAGTITNCVFDGAGLAGLRLWGSAIADSTFRRADLRGGALGTAVWHGRRNTWRNVVFDRANLREATFTAAILDTCSFEKTSKQLHLVDCDVRACHFRGELNSLVIDGRGHRHRVDPSAFFADFSQAVFRNCSIIGYHLDNVVLPAQDDLVVLRRYPGLLRAARDWLLRPDATELERRTAGILDYPLKAPGTEDSDYCFDLNGFDDPDTIAVLGRAFAHVQGH